MFLGLESSTNPSSDPIWSNATNWPRTAIRTAVARAPSSRSLRVFRPSCNNAGYSSSYWARPSVIKRCCDIRLPFTRKRQQSFATSSS